MNLRSIMGPFVGGVIDIVATNILTLPLIVYVASSTSVSHAKPDAAGGAVLNALQSSPSLQATAWLLGLIATVLGGYIAALIARTAQVRAGALSSWLCVGSGVYGMIAGIGHAPLWQHLLAFVLSPMFAALGGYLRLLQVQRRRQQLEV